MAKQYFSVTALIVILATILVLFACKEDSRSDTPVEDVEQAVEDSTSTSDVESGVSEAPISLGSEKAPKESAVTPLVSKVVPIPAKPAVTAHWVEKVAAMVGYDVVPLPPSGSEEATASAAFAAGKLCRVPASKTVAQFVGEAWKIKAHLQGKAVDTHAVLVELGWDKTKKSPAGFHSGATPNEILEGLFNRLRNDNREQFAPDVLAALRLLQEFKEQGGTGEPNWDIVYSAWKGATEPAEVPEVTDPKALKAFREEYQVLTTPSLRSAKN